MAERTDRQGATENRATPLAHGHEIQSRKRGMRGRLMVGGWASLVMLLIAVIFVRAVAAQRAVAPAPPAPPPPATYNPYPPGILPSDLDPELARVRREVRFIFNQALAEWRALPPPTLTGQPPTLQSSGYSMVITLGKLMNFDENISVFKNVACASCHMPYAGFSGPIPSVNLTMIAYPGSVHYRAGKRTAQRYTYSPYFPALQFNDTQQLFFGGNFWDSRATGYLLQNPDAEQA